MPTSMQAAFAKNKYCRQIMFQGTNNYISFIGNKRLYNKLYKGIAISMPESEIKYYIYWLLQCDIPPAAAKELIEILKLSKTRLTAEQRRHYFYI